MKYAPSYFEWAEGRPQNQIKPSDIVEVPQGTFSDTGVVVEHISEDEFRRHFRGYTNFLDSFGEVV